MKQALLGLLLPALLLPLAGCAEQAPPPTSPSPAAEARPLTQEEIDRINEAFLSHTEQDGVAYATPVSGFFTSYYDDVKNLDFAEFLRYFPGDGLVEKADQAEFDALSVLPDFPFAQETADLKWTSPSDLPVPIHRILRTSVDETLERYAGITTTDLTNTDGTLYLAEYDAWYTFTSDFGPGTFLCAGGEVDEAAGSALLWAEPREDGSRIELALERDGEDWHIRSFRNNYPDPDGALTTLLSSLQKGEVGEYTWSGQEEQYIYPDDLAELLRTAAASPVERDSLGEDILWTLDVPIIPAANYSGKGTLHLSARLEENMVEVSGRDGLPAGTLYLKNQELYQLIRTSRDYEGFINETYYEKYQDIVDGYFDSRLEEVKDAGYVSWELSEFLGVLGTTKQDGKGIVAFRMNAAFSTDPPELAPDRIAGGAYVDSQLRVHGLDFQSVYLVTLDDDPMGIAFGDDIIDFIDDHWGADVDPAELQAVIDASTRKG